MKKLFRRIRSKFLFFGAFYYSRKMSQIVHTDNHFTPLFSKKSIRYTLWNGRFPFTNYSKWDDVKFLGFGFVSDETLGVAK